jgi:hypothetical protein
MTSTEFKHKLLEEIDLIPEEELDKLYDVIHGFRLSLKEQLDNRQKIMSFAGCWLDMPDAMYSELLEELETRRQQAFSRRRSNETSFD